MAAKKIDVSIDNGVTWFTLPGGSGELTQEAGQLPDTVFGQTYESNESGLINWGISADAVYKGFAGYVADIKKPGTSTIFTTEAHTLVSGKRYRINDVTKRIWDRTAITNVFDGGVDKNAEVLAINYLFGEVVFKTTYTVTGAVTVTGKYFPTTVLGKAQGYTLTQTANPINDTVFETAQANGGYLTHSPGLRTVSLDLDGVYALTSGMAALLAARTELIIEIDPTGTGKSIAKGFFKLVTDNQSGDVGALEEEALSFVLSVPDPATNVEMPFGWFHDPTTTLSTAVKNSLDSWVAETKVDVRYMPDGVTGNKGDAVVTEITLSASLDEVNRFAVSFQGDGALTAF